MNDENPFHPPGEVPVATAGNAPKRSKAVIIGMYVWILITYMFNVQIAGFLIRISGLSKVDVMDMMVLFGREMLVVYLIISSLALFRCKPKTYAITTAIVIAALFVRTYIDCVMDGSLDSLVSMWIILSVFSLASPYLYVTETFLVRRIKSSMRT